MKKIILIIFIGYPFFLFSQVDKPITKGNFIIGGSFSGNYKKITDVGYNYNGNIITNATSTNYFIDCGVNIGYFLKDGLALGISTSFSYSSTGNKNYNAYKRNIYSLGGGPYLKYYFINGILLGLNTAFNYQNQADEFVPFEYTGYEHIKMYNITPSIGYAFFINSKISIEPMIRYSYTRSFSKTGSTSFDKLTNGFFFSIVFEMFL